MRTTRPELRGDFGMVSSTQWLATSTGMSVLERGGNAFDAAVAAGLVLQVVEPHLDGPGGEVPIIGWTSRQQASFVVAGQGGAPAAADIGAFRRLGLSAIPGTGVLAACVPGAFGAWMRLLRDHGTWDVASVMSYAIGYAERGFATPPRMVEAVDSVVEVFESHWPTSAAAYLGSNRPRPGGLSRNPALAGTFARICREARAAGPDRERGIEAATDAFYRGFVAEAIDRFCREPHADATGRVSSGLIDGEDMAAYAAGIEPPETLEYRGRVICKTAAWGQGPVLLQQLALLEGFDLEGMGARSAEWIHTVVEAQKLAFADRDAWYGDPRFVEVPMPDLLDPSYAGRRRALIGRHADVSLRPGDPGGREPRLPVTWQGGGSVVPGGGEPAARRLGRGDTCHVDVVDRFGNMVAAMPSGGWLQSSPVIPALGFPLGTRAQMFWLDEAHPNALEPGKRPRTTLSPTLVLQDGQPILACGSPGGDFQDQWGTVFLLSVIDHGLGLQAAIDAPTFHTGHLIGSFEPRPFEEASLYLEGRIPATTVGVLEQRGHRVTVADPWSLGYLCAVGRDPRTGELLAASNPRDGQGFATGR